MVSKTKLSRSSHEIATHLSGVCNEFIYTLKTDLTENEIHVEVLFIVALIARKVIILDVKEFLPFSLMVLQRL